eukprot:TRINITY_DN7855_c0_g1::TRINITY_DN7855_c0_g1_i1::g.23683::m.23683 TRINITY_DN7855_c0_g1::TRINITY_DN7855_c0_g1_i1::g.23683  ORF type:complete len:458 (-),score=50.02,sp/Q6DIY3/2ABD_XENTR/22.73/5e-10,WD40/PF00400.27/0.14,WD40/PF00400.27/50,WD40/PF00400.27/7.4e+03,WD40/PF00400.27/1.7e+03 TRINITY_DN7855_c0_g1_i1:124-1497(-)
MSFQVQHSQYFGGLPSNVDDTSQLDKQSVEFYHGLTSIEFSPCGDYLATGDRSGVVVIFANDTDAQAQDRSQEPDNDYTLDDLMIGVPTVGIPFFDSVAAFPDASPRKSPVRSLRWIKQAGFSQDSTHNFLIACDMSVKLWRVKCGGSDDVVANGREKRIWSMAHTGTHPIGLSIHPDSLTFLSVNAFDIYLHDFQRDSLDSFRCITSSKPSQAVFTSAAFAPRGGGEFWYGMSDGLAAMRDLRDASSFVNTKPAIAFANDYGGAVEGLCVSNNGPQVAVRRKTHMALYDPRHTRGPVCIMSTQPTTTTSPQSPASGAAIIGGTSANTSNSPGTNGGSDVAMPEYDVTKHNVSCGMGSKYFCTGDVRRNLQVLDWTKRESASLPPRPKEFVARSNPLSSWDAISFKDMPSGKPLVKRRSSGEGRRSASLTSFHPTLPFIAHTVDHILCFSYLKSMDR